MTKKYTMTTDDFAIISIKEHLNVHTQVTITPWALPA